MITFDHNDLYGGSVMESKSKEILNVREAAELLGCHDRTLRRYVKEGKLKAYKLGGTTKRSTLKFLREDLLKLLKSISQAGQNQTGATRSEEAFKKGVPMALLQWAGTISERDAEKMLQAIIESRTISNLNSEK